MSIISSIQSAGNSILGAKSSISGTYRTDGVTPISIIGPLSNKRYPPGFTPNESYIWPQLSSSDTGPGHSNKSWYGVLLDNHPDYSNTLDTKSIYLTTEERFNESKGYPNFRDNIPDPSRFYSTRDSYLLFNDSSTDYFRHGLQIIDNKTPLRSAKNNRETWDGSEEGVPLRLANVLSGIDKGTSFENNDPVIFGFELVIDAVSSPLLNGSVEDFINQFSRVSEIASKKIVISDFKQQFPKIFKTMGKINTEPITQKTISIPTSNYADADSQKTIFSPGKAAYLSYYLKGITGLDLLIESNSSEKKKYLVDYRKDMIKFSFYEDISLSLGTLAHLYKLLYWSKPNGKNIVPENLLRFNCDIIISEVRNLNRVRRAIDTNSLEIIKDNVSRHIYSLRECQFWFDKPAHDSQIDLGGDNKPFEPFDVGMDFKYVTSKFERWTPDASGFGQYVGYNNGAIWKIGNPGGRGTQSISGTIVDTSVPKFYTVGVNTLSQNGVLAPIALRNYNYSFPVETPESIDKSDTKRTKGKKSVFENFKDASKSAGRKLSKNLQNAVNREVREQINIRFRLLNNSLDKIRNAVGLGRMREPTNVYTSYKKISDSTGISQNFFFDIHNSLRDFGGEAIGSVLGSVVGGVIKGGR